MRAGASGHEVFPRADGPWTPYGAYRAYSALAEAMGRHVPTDPVGEDELVWPDGDAADDAPIAITRTPLARPILDQGRVQVFAGGGEGLPRLVLFGEPAVLRMADPFLRANLSRLVVVEGRFFHPELVRAERPDFVVTVFPEYHLGAPTLFGNELERVHFTGITGIPLPLPAD
jgi:hypothetical protein